jgi:hypothetical protein
MTIVLQAKKEKSLIQQGISKEFYGADDGVRTRNIQLGKLTLCQLNYIRIYVGTIVRLFRLLCNIPTGVANHVFPVFSPKFKVGSNISLLRCSAAGHNFDTVAE